QRRQERQRDSIGELIEAYIEQQRQRARLTAKHAESIPRKRRLSAGGLADIESGIGTFKAWLTEQGQATARVGSASGFESVLTAYRAWLDRKLEKGDYTPHTVNNKVKVLRPLVDWLWQNHHLRDMPRVLDRVTAKYKPEPQA